MIFRWLTFQSYHLYKNCTFQHQTVFIKICLLNRTAFSCSLKEIPESFSGLTDLKILDLSYNLIESLPQGLSKLSNLTKLDLSYCSLSSIPQDIGNLYNLKEMYKYSLIQTFKLHNYFLL